jgi:hypothetical protein
LRLILFSTLDIQSMTINHANSLWPIERRQDAVGSTAQPFAKPYKCRAVYMAVRMFDGVTVVEARKIKKWVCAHNLILYKLLPTDISGALGPVGLQGCGSMNLRSNTNRAGPLLP